MSKVDIDTSKPLYREDMDDIANAINDNDTAINLLFNSVAGFKKTKDALRSYAGTTKRIVFLTDVSGSNFAVYRPGDITQDNADNENATVRVIVDSDNRRYRLMTLSDLLSLFLESYLPENL